MSARAPKPVGKLLFTPGLTHGEIGARALTYEGQASWADESLGKNCIECALYITEKLKKHRCLKYRSLMRQWGAQFPPSAIACKFYQPRAGQ
jgi:hypothetical protein